MPAPTTTAGAVEELLPGFESPLVLVTEAEFVTLPCAVAVMTSEIVALLFGASVPIEHVTVPAALLHVPWLGVAETKVVFAGRTSVTVTASAWTAELFVTVIV